MSINSSVFPHLQASQSCTCRLPDIPATDEYPLRFLALNDHDNKSQPAVTQLTFVTPETYPQANKK